jgi:hypothetical protein
MARRRSGRGSGGFFSKIMWAFLILCLVFAWFKTPIPAGSSIHSVEDFAVAKSHAVDAWVHSLKIPGMNPASPTSDPATTTPVTTAPSTP